MDKQFAEALVAKYPYEVFNVGKGVAVSEDIKFKFLAVCIAVSGTNELSVFAAEKQIFEKIPTIPEAAELDPKEFGSFLSKVGIRFGARKGDFIQRSAEQLLRNHNGQMPDDRKQLEKFPGVSRHIASIIRSAIFGHNEFAVDHHVRRQYRRFGLGDASDLQIEKYFKTLVEPEQWAHLSRALVDFGQDICGGFQPRCNDCPFAGRCKSAGKPNQFLAKSPNVRPAPAMPAALDRNAFEKMEFPSSKGDKMYVVAVRQGKLACTCMGFRFNRKCKHVTQAAEMLTTKMDEFA